MCDDDNLVSLGIKGHKNVECRLSCGKPAPLRYPFSESEKQQQYALWIAEEFSTVLKKHQCTDGTHEELN